MKLKFSYSLLAILLKFWIITNEIFAIKNYIKLKSLLINNKEKNFSLSTKNSENKNYFNKYTDKNLNNDKSKNNFNKNQLNKNKSTIESESNEIKSLITYRIDKKHPFSYYQHYLVKNRLIVFPETEGEYPYTLGKCTDLNCYNCDPIFPDKCKKCATGFFLYNLSCGMSCPEGFIANTLTGRCVPRNLNENSFLMAYSIGSCINRCGKKSADCSCSEDCKKTGDCCSDYNIHDCDGIVDRSKIVADKCDKNCALCEENNDDDDKKPICVQCPNGKYFYRGKCYFSCPEDTFKNDINSTCHEIKNCSVENCDSCLDNNIIYCKQCVNGYFLFEGKCVKACPNRYRADRIMWTCLEYPLFAWYWVHPSQTSCNKQCGKSKDETMDCSCSSDCYRLGNCCQDVDTFCLHFDILRKKD